MLKNLLIALVRLYLKFSNVVWSLKLIKDKKLIEEIQLRAIKFTRELSNIPYEERFKLSSLYYHQTLGDMIEVCKYTHGPYSANPHLLYINQESITREH